MFRISLPLTYIALLFLCAWGLTAVQMEHFADDPGVGWHLATGKLIAETSSVPRTDPFLFLPSNEPPRRWVADQWLSDLFIYQAYQLGSWPLLYALGASLFLAAFFLLLYPTARATITSPLLILLALGLCFKAAQVQFILRPVLIAFFTFALVVACYTRLTISNTQHPSTSTKKLSAILILSHLVWANIHPSFVIGLSATGVTCAGLFITNSSLKIRIQLFTTFFLACLATLINPHGYHLHQSIFWLGRSSYFLSLNSEWQPIKFSSFEGVLFLLILLPQLALPFNSKDRLRDIILAAPSFILALATLHSIRFLPFFAISAVVPTSLGFSLIFESLALSKLKILGVSRRFFTALSNQERTARYHAAFPATIILVWIVASLALESLPFFTGAFGPSKDRYPYLALATAISSAKTQSPITVLAPPDWGGFITWWGQGKARAVIDDRNTLLGEEIYREILPLFYHNFPLFTEPRQTLARYKPDIILLPRSAYQLPHWHGLSLEPEYHPDGAILRVLPKGEQ